MPSDESPPKITVVIPVRNEERLLPDTLQSIREQTFTDYECLVVDNGSTDNSAQIAQRFGCRIATEKRPGVGFARQRGFEEARGEIVASTDADTVVPSDWLELIARSFQQEPDLVAVYGTIRFRERQGPGKRLAESLFKSFLRLYHSLGRPHFCGPNFAVRREAFHAVDGFKDGDHFYSVSEDVQLSLKLKEKGDIRFHKGLVVYTSPRRLGKGGHRYLWYHTKNYWSVVWLRKRR